MFEAMLETLVEMVGRDSALRSPSEAPGSYRVRPMKNRMWAWRLRMALLSGSISSARTMSEQEGVGEIDICGCGMLLQHPLEPSEARPRVFQVLTEAYPAFVR